MNALIYAALFVLTVAVAGFVKRVGWVQRICLFLLLAYSVAVWLFWNASIRAHVMIAQQEGRSSEFIEGMIARHGNARGDGLAALMGSLGLGLLVLACIVPKRGTFPRTSTRPTE